MRKSESATKNDPTTKTIFHLNRRYCNVLAYMTLFMCLIAAFKAPAQTGAAVNMKEQQAQTIAGVVVDTLGQPIEGATVSIRGSSHQTQTDEYGRFALRAVENSGTLRVRFVGYHDTEASFTIPSREPILLELVSLENVIEEVEVSTGYQTIPKERATGSFVHIDNELLNRTPHTDILSRLEGVTNGLLFVRNSSDVEPQLSIRGPSTIHSDPSPLIVLDNFEFHGDINNINPNDVESITILKDAAAASIWGAKAGNGVIVITTKRGRYNEKLNISFGTNLSVSSKPDLFSVQRIKNSDYIDLEVFLFNQGHYNNTLSNINMSPVSPVVWALYQLQNGLISPADTLDLIHYHKGFDTRNDIDQYFNRNPVMQQHIVSVNGGGEINRYYASLGWDKNIGSRIGNSYNRLTINVNNSYSFFNNNLEVTAGIMYTQTKDEQNGHQPTAGYPYARFADSEGNRLSIARYRPSFLEHVSSEPLLDWTYTPLDELYLGDNTTKSSDINLNLSGRYKVTSFLNASVLYRYVSGSANTRDHRSQESFFTRDLINQYSQVQPNGEVIRPIPLGGILNSRSERYDGHYMRGQFELNKSWGNNSLNGLIGGEINDVTTKLKTDRLYGYNKERETAGVVDYVNPFTSYITNRTNIRVPLSQNLGHLVDRFVSLYANASYAFEDRYMVSASFRKDASNLFGVATNQKWVPLWSAGAMWNISNEPFFRVEWIPKLTLRSTYGKSGNIDRRMTAFLTAISAPLNIYTMPTMMVNNPPNSNLKWETVTTINLGLDFALLETSRLRGSLEYYWKIGNDLVGNAEIATSSGLSTFRGNLASMKGKGLDISITSKNLTGVLKWTSNAIYSYTNNEVTQYLVEPASTSSFMSASVDAYKVGHPVHAIYGYRWGGLDPKTGNPKGFLNGEMTDNYSAILSASNIDELLLIGSSIPTHFGSIRNTFDWRSLSLSFNMKFKLGYYFLRRSLNYSSLFNGVVSSGNDYGNRWQAPGDEKYTQVPSLVYPAVSSRDNFYQNSSILYESGNHVRLQDIRLAYTWRQIPYARSHFGNFQVFAMVNNLGLIWKNNNHDLDPDSRDMRPPHTFLAGIKIEL